MSLLKKLSGHLLFAMVILAIAAASLLWLADHDVAGAFNGLAVKTLAFAVASFSVIIMELFYAWRYQINAIKTFNTIEADSAAAARFLGYLTVGLCILAAAIYGQI